MVKALIALLFIGQSLFALNGVYQSSIYPMCTTEQYLKDWVRFANDKDVSSQKAYYGIKCFILNSNISVSGIQTDWGTVSFFVKGNKLFGLREGISTK